MKLPSLPKLPGRRSRLLQEQLQERVQTIDQLTQELDSRNQQIEHLAESYAAHDMTAIFDGLRQTLSEQIDKTRDHSGQQYWHLLERLEQGRARIEKLQMFISIAMRHIGRLEGQIKSAGRVVFTDSESRDVITAAESYQKAIQNEGDPS